MQKFFRQPFFDGKGRAEDEDAADESETEHDLGDAVYDIGFSGSGGQIDIGEKPVADLQVIGVFPKGGIFFLKFWIFFIVFRYEIPCRPVTAGGQKDDGGTDRFFLVFPAAAEGVEKGFPDVKIQDLRVVVASDLQHQVALTEDDFVSHFFSPFFSVKALL